MEELWDTTYELCQQAGIPQEELDQCTKTFELLKLLRQVRDRDRKRSELRKIDKRFKNRDRKQHGNHHKK